MTHVSFPSLEQFNSVFARETWDGLAERRTLHYRAKIKLHGTNLGISIDPSGCVSAQSRGLLLTLETDLHNFVEWLTPPSISGQPLSSPNC